ncbi:MAG: MarR family transcriptional regulator [Planctomycetes bacterium]|nr:MarR family transcriptional regulator [Planctomycetota bacterium]MBI3843684.1 MarR family transcriptional regulator [Planctomycetota bacterium]
MSNAQQIDFLFHSILSRFFSIPAKRPASGNVTLAQMRVLWILERKKTAALGELARALGVSCSTATGLVDRLVTSGCVRRVQAKGDRRQVVLTLRPRGQRHLVELAKRRQARFQRLCRSLDDVDLRRMVEAMETLNEVMGKWREP